MEKKIPNIVFLEYSLRGILDTLFTPKIQQLLFEKVIDEIKKSHKTTKKEIVICNINQFECDIAISKNDFIPALESALNYYVQIEDYPKCTQINKLIQEIQDGRRIKT